jgi:hypothetical protein
MLAVYRHRLAFADDFHRYSLLKPPSLSKRDDLHAAHHQVIKQSDINQLQRLLNTRSDLTICIAGFGKA